MLIVVHFVGAVAGIVAGCLLGRALAFAREARWIARNRAEIERMRAEVEAEFCQRGE